MRRFKGNPIIKPIVGHPWESRMVFNAAAAYHEDRVHILYRAAGEDGISRLGYASSSDGYHVDERLPQPVFVPSSPSERNGCEDPRLTPLDGEYVMTYTALRSLVRCAFQIATTSISIEDLSNKMWNWGERRLPFPGVRNKDAVIFSRMFDGRYVMYHRIEHDVCVAYSEDLKHWGDIRAVMGPRLGMWDRLKIGVAGPPIEVDEGWLQLYHGVDFNRIYRLGAALIDKDDPERVLHRIEDPILEPEEEYERYGRVPNVVFSCGSVLIDSELIVYYGAADTVLCAATFDLGELIH